MSRNNNIYRKGSIHVLSEQCATCIFRPGNLMSLRRGTVKKLATAAVADNSAIVCHETLGTSANAICRGFYDRYQTQPLAIAKLIGAIVEQEPPKS